MNTTISQRIVNSSFVNTSQFLDACKNCPTVCDTSFNSGAKCSMTTEEQLGLQGQVIRRQYRHTNKQLQVVNIRSHIFIHYDVLS